MVRKAQPALLALWALPAPTELLVRLEQPESWARPAVTELLAKPERLALPVTTERQARPELQVLTEPRATRVPQAL